ncbi:MAG: ComEC/Rec2 family competence protein [Caulobacteraceae bacterium]|nr:ComEC/Rec2 family competence protein [Caulobacteraceae bacterium]
MIEEVQAQADRASLWTPVAFGAGAAVYLGLKREPPLWPLALAAVCLAVLALAARRWVHHRGVVIAVSLMAVVSAGLLAGKLHSDAVAAPIIPPHFGVVPIEGWVMDVANPSATGQRLVIAPVRIGGLSPDQIPFRVRIVCPQGGYGPGTPIRVVALLDPPPGPAAPRAYDFARDAWFQGLGGVGLAMKPVEVIDLEPPPWRLRLAMALNAARWSLAERLADDLRQALGDDDGGAVGLAVTVATSHEDWLDPQSRDDLRYSGLAHMLAIAGLHMAAVSGFVFFAVRLGVAAWPWLALRVSGKKIAAAAGLVAVAIYLVLSGAHPPARRAAITASVAFIAILCGRRAVSLHSLSIAALIILALQPEVVVQPGFEMSFCATAALVALAEIWPHAKRSVGLPWYLAAPQRMKDWLVAMFMVSLVAGAATSPFAIQHFNRIANYGLFANLTADLIASLVLMPALALSVLADALGLGALAVHGPVLVAGWAARSIVWLGHVFATAPGAAKTYPSAPDPALLISYVGLVFLCLWKGRLRWLGLPLAAAVALWPRPAPPVAWVASDGADAAVVSAGQEIALKPGKRSYAIDLWAQRWGLTEPDDPTAALAGKFQCDRQSCAPAPGLKPALAAWWSTRAPKPERLDALCRGAEILILRSGGDVPPNCSSALVLRGSDFARGGAAEILSTPRGYRVVWSQPFRGVRPWTAASAD